MSYKGPEDIIKSLLNKYKDVYIVQLILKNQYKIDIELNSLIKRKIK